MDQYVKAIFEMHTKSGAAEAIELINPMQASQLGIDTAIEEWGPASIERIAKIRSKLSAETAGHSTILHAIDALQETYLKAGY